MAVVSIKNKLRSGSLLVGNEAYSPIPVFTQFLTTGGNASNGSLKLTYIYNIAADTWTAKADRLQNGGEGPAAGYYNGSGGGTAGVYSWGGGYDNNYASNQFYDVSSNTWSAKTSMPAGRLDQPYLTYNNQFWTFGGKAVGSNATKRETYVYDPVSNSWTQKTDMPDTKGVAPTGVVSDKAYVIAGYQNLGPGSSYSVYTNYEYNFATNTWATKANCSFPHWNGGTGGTSDGTYVYCVGGGDEPSGTNRKKVERYDPVTNTYTTMADTNTFEGYDPALFTSGKIYALSAPANVYTVSSNSWVTRSGTKANPVSRQAGAGIP